MKPTLDQQTLQQIQELLQKVDRYRERLQHLFIEENIIKIYIDKVYGFGYAYLLIKSENADDLLDQLATLGERKDNRVLIEKKGNNSHESINQIYDLILKDLINKGYPNCHVITTENNER